MNVATPPTGRCFSQLTQNEPCDPNKQKLYIRHYDAARGSLLTASARHNTRYSKVKIDYEGKSYGKKEHIKETKIADSDETARVRVQIRGGIEDKTKIFFSLFSTKTYVVTPH